jgi:hypothetical protein
MVGKETTWKSETWIGDNIKLTLNNGMGGCGLNYLRWDRFPIAPEPLDSIKCGEFQDQLFCDRLSQVK